MLIDDKLLEKLETLGMIRINTDKKEKIKQDLNEIFEFVQNISDINVQDITTDDVQDKYTPLREDIKNIDTQIPKSILKNAPNAKEGYFIVPKIIE